MRVGLSNPRYKDLKIAVRRRSTKSCIGSRKCRGVASAGSIQFPPLGGMLPATGFWVAGRPTPPTQRSARHGRFHRDAGILPHHGNSAAEAAGCSLSTIAPARRRSPSSASRSRGSSFPNMRSDRPALVRAVGPRDALPDRRRGGRREARRSGQRLAPHRVFSERAGDADHRDAGDPHRRAIR